MRMANTGIDVTFWSMGYAATVACPSRDPPAFLGMGCGGYWKHRKFVGYNNSTRAGLHTGNNGVL